MTQDEIRNVVLAALRAVAPDADPTELDPREDVRDALDLDSMDILRFARTLHERLAIDVPETDYARIVTLEGCIAYLTSKLAARAS